MATETNSPSIENEEIDFQELTSNEGIRSESSDSSSKMEEDEEDSDGEEISSDEEMSSSGEISDNGIISDDEGFLDRQKIINYVKNRYAKKNFTQEKAQTNQGAFQLCSHSQKNSNHSLPSNELKNEQNGTVYKRIYYSAGNVTQGGNSAQNNLLSNTNLVQSRSSTSGTIPIEQLSAKYATTGQSQGLTGQVNLVGPQLPRNQSQIISSEQNFLQSNDFIPVNNSRVCVHQSQMLSGNMNNNVRNQNSQSGNSTSNVSLSNGNNQQFRGNLACYPQNTIFNQQNQCNSSNNRIMVGNNQNITASSEQIHSSVSTMTSNNSVNCAPSQQSQFNPPTEIIINNISSQNNSSTGNRSNTSQNNEKSIVEVNIITRNDKLDIDLIPKCNIPGDGGVCKSRNNSPCRRHVISIVTDNASQVNVNIQSGNIVSVTSDNGNLHISRDRNTHNRNVIQPPHPTNNRNIGQPQENNGCNRSQGNFSTCRLNPQIPFFLHEIASMPICPDFSLIRCNGCGQLFNRNLEPLLSNMNNLRSYRDKNPIQNRIPERHLNLGNVYIGNNCPSLGSNTMSQEQNNHVQLNSLPIQNNPSQSRNNQIPPINLLNSLNEGRPSNVSSSNQSSNNPSIVYNNVSNRQMNGPPLQQRFLNDSDQRRIINNPRNGNVNGERNLPFNHRMYGNPLNEIFITSNNVNRSLNNSDRMVNLHRIHVDNSGHESRSVRNIQNRHIFNRRSRREEEFEYRRNSEVNDPQRNINSLGVYNRHMFNRVVRSFVDSQNTFSNVNSINRLVNIDDVLNDIPSPGFHTGRNNVHRRRRILSNAILQNDDSFDETDEENP